MELIILLVVPYVMAKHIGITLSQDLEYIDHYYYKARSSTDYYDWLEVMRAWEYYTDSRI